MQNLQEWQRYFLARSPDAVYGIRDERSRIGSVFRNATGGLVHERGCIGRYRFSQPRPWIPQAPSRLRVIVHIQFNVADP